MSDLLSHPLFAMIFLLGVLVFVHEFAHFVVGKVFGIGVEVFSIGFGPKLIGFQYKGTDYRIACLPLGGYVKFAGSLPMETSPEPFRGKELYNASRFAQFCTMLAGPLANLLLAVAVYGYLGARGIEHPAPIIGQVRFDSPAERAGFASGDKVLSINGESILSWNNLQEKISSSPGKTLSFIVSRHNQELQLSVVPDAIPLEDFAGRNEPRGRIGIGFGLLPSLVDLLPGQNQAKLAGIFPGSKITNVRILEKDIPIKTWDDFLSTLQVAYERHLDALDLELESPQSKKTERKTLKISNLHSGLKSKTELAHTLGLVNAELSLASVREPSSVALAKGDRLLAVEGQVIKDVYGLSEFLQSNEKEQVSFTIQRGEQTLEERVPLLAEEQQRPSGKVVVYTLPVEFMGSLVPPPPVLEKYDSFFEDLNFAYTTTLRQSTMLAKVVWGLFTGQVPLKSLGGPILIAKVAGDSAKMGAQVFLTSLALISINLGIINLLPIPALDGGKIVMVVCEAVLRRRLSITFVENYQKIGVLMMLALVVLATYNDVSRFWSSILKSLVGYF